MIGKVFALGFVGGGVMGIVVINSAISPHEHVYIGPPLKPIAPVTTTPPGSGCSEYIMPDGSCRQCPPSWGPDCRGTSPTTIPPLVAPSPTPTTTPGMIHEQFI